MKRPPPRKSGLRNARFFLMTMLLSSCNVGICFGQEDNSAQGRWFPPIMYLEPLGHYKDPLTKGGHGSIVDPEAAKKNHQIAQPLLDFLSSEEDALDKTGVSKGDPDADRAYKNFEAWAKAGAMTKEPVPFNGEWAIDRMFYTLGMNVIALKFKAAGYLITPTILNWLDILNHKYMSKYENSSGNQYVWAGAAAALYSLLSEDRQAIAFQEKVWRDTLNSINEDGSIDTELKRGIMSANYHNRALTGILYLRAARAGMGHHASADRVARIKLLGDFIARSLCDPTEMQNKAHVTSLQKPALRFNSVVSVFGADLASSDWTNCYPPPGPDGFKDPDLGGDMRETKRVLDQIAQLNKQH